MTKHLSIFFGAALLAATAALAQAQAGLTLAVTMTNDPTTNKILVYNAGTQKLVQTLKTNGKGGVAGNARGIKAYGNVVAVVNNGSNNVSVFRRVGNQLAFEKLITTTSAPVSIDFANNHMYVAGATTVDSFAMFGDSVEFKDGSTGLLLAGGGAPANGGTAQVGAVDDSTLLVTIKTDPIPGTVDIVTLRNGAVSNTNPTAISAPSASLTPFGFSVYADGTAVITLAHSSQFGLFRGGAFTTEVSSAQGAPCWSTLVGKYVFTANTVGKTISRLVGTGNNIFVDNPVAASMTTGGAPSDIDAAGGVLGVIDHVSGGAPASNLSLFSYNAFGELAGLGFPISLPVSTANGVAIVGPGSLLP